MEKNVNDFVYLDTSRYISLRILKNLYCASLFFSLIVLIYGIVGESLALVIMILLWNVSYIIFICILYNKHVCKTFSLRFLVNGITCVFIDSILLILLCAFILVTKCVRLNLMWWWLLLWMICVFAYFYIIVLGVRKGFFGQMKQKAQNKTWNKILRLAATLMTSMGILGMLVAKSMQRIVSENIQRYVLIVLLFLLILLVSLGFINFVQYYYCKKYSIQCDEYGNTSSTLLEPIKRRSLKQ